MPEPTPTGHVGHGEPGHPAYEKKDANMEAVIGFGVGLAASVFVIQMIILGLYALLAHHAEQSQPALSQFMKQELKALPQKLGDIPEPRVQESDVNDLKHWKTQQQSQLNGLGWVNKEKGVAHIPIADVIQILADPAQQAAHGVLVKKK